MLAELGSIIDGLYDELRAGRSLRKRVVFIAGNGIRHVSNILNDDDLKRRAKPQHTRTPSAWEAFKWRHFEFARFFTATALPSFAHCCIRQLVEDGLCRDVVTTNYDLFFDTIW